MQRGVLTLILLLSVAQTLWAVNPNEIKSLLEEAEKTLHQSDNYLERMMEINRFGLLAWMYAEIEEYEKAEEYLRKVPRSEFHASVLKLLSGLRDCPNKKQQHFLELVHSRWQSDQERADAFFAIGNDEAAMNLVDPINLSEIAFQLRLENAIIKKDREELRTLLKYREQSPSKTNAAKRTMLLLWLLEHGNADLADLQTELKLSPIQLSAIGKKLFDVGKYQQAIQYFKALAIINPQLKSPEISICQGKLNQGFNQEKGNLTVEYQLFLRSLASFVLLANKQRNQQQLLLLLEEIRTLSKTEKVFYPQIILQWELGKKQQILADIRSLETTDRITAFLDPRIFQHSPELSQFLEPVFLKNLAQDRELFQDDEQFKVLTTLYAKWIMNKKAVRKYVLALPEEDRSLGILMFTQLLTEHESLSVKNFFNLE